MPVAWDDDNPADAVLLAANIAVVLRRISFDAERRISPTVAMAQQWHRDLYEGIDLPVAYFAGEIRNSDPRYPELVGYEVRVGRYLGVASEKVPAALERFEADLQDAVVSVDTQLLDRGELGATEVELYVTLVAVTHGEWIRIHPFANGNWRIARLWTHWLAARYGLPPLVRAKPRPVDRVYVAAAAASMTGDHRLMRAWLLARFV